MGELWQPFLPPPHALNPNEHTILLVPNTEACDPRGFRTRACHLASRGIMISKTLKPRELRRRSRPGLLRALAFVSLALGWLSPSSAQGASFQFTGSMTRP